MTTPITITRDTIDGQMYHLYTKGSPGLGMYICSIHIDVLGDIIDGLTADALADVSEGGTDASIELIVD